MQHLLSVFEEETEKVTFKVRLRNCYLDTFQKAKLFYPDDLKQISVEFVGEVAIDDAGPMRENVLHNI